MTSDPRRISLGPPGHKKELSLNSYTVVQIPGNDTHTILKIGAHYRGGGWEPGVIGDRKCMGGGKRKGGGQEKDEKHFAT